MIGVILPYNRSETTCAALRLAEFLLAYGYDFRLIPFGPRCDNLHPFWDRQIASSSTSFLTPLQGCKTLVYFQHSLPLLFIAQSVCADAKHIAVPIWREFSETEQKVLSGFHEIVWSSSVGVDWWNRFVGTPKSRFCVWLPSYSEKPREGFVADQQIRAAVYADSNVVRYYPEMTLRLIEHLLHSYSKLYVELVAVCSWPKRHRRQLVKLRKTWEGRLRYTKNTELVSLWDFCLRNDWVLYPAAKSSFAFPVTQALASGCAVLAPRLPIFLDVLIDHVNGLLVPWEVLPRTYYDAEVLPFSWNYWVEICDRAFRSPHLFLRLQTCRKEVALQPKQFHDTWKKVLSKQN